MAEEQGIHVPEEIAIVGFDDNPLSAHVRPPLTTIHQPFAEMGYQASQLLFTMIETSHSTTKKPQAEATDTPLRIQVSTHLVTRTSSGLVQPHSPS